MAWPFTSDEEDPYTVPGVGGLLPPMPQSQIIPTSDYRGLLGSAPNQDVALAIASLGAGLAGGRGRTRGEAWGSGLQQGMTGLLGTATLSGRQKALEQEVALREQDRQMRAQQMAFAQAEATRKRDAIAKLARENPQIASLLEAGLGGDYFKPQKVGPGESVGIPATGQTLLQGGPRTTEASPIAKLVQERDALPPDSPLRQTYDAAIQKAVTVTPPASVNIGFQSPLAVDTPQGPRFVMPPNKPGGVPQVLEIPGMGPAVPPAKVAEPKDPTEFQSKAGIYAQSMETASKILTDIEAKNPGAVRPPVQELVTPNQLRGTVTSETRQKYVQGQKQWIDSINRIRSGAQLPEIEYERALMTFFPVLGESDAAIKQKAAARAAEEKFIREAAGRALQGAKPATPQQPSAPAPSGSGWRIVPGE